MNTQKQAIIFRSLQILALLPCILIELMNLITDIERHHWTTNRIHSIISNPKLAKSTMLFSRQIDHVWVAHVVSGMWTIAHAAIGILLLLGAIQLLRAINKDKVTYQAHKLKAIIGLTIGWLWYFTMLGINRDYFLSWLVENVNSNDMLYYGVPLFITLLIILFLDKSTQS